MAEEPIPSAPAALPFWLRPGSILGRLDMTTFIESSHLLAMPSTLALYRLDAGSCTFLSRLRCSLAGRDTLSAGFARLVALPQYRLGYG